MAKILKVPWGGAEQEITNNHVATTIFNDEISKRATFILCIFDILFVFAYLLLVLSLNSMFHLHAKAAACLTKL